MTHVKELIEQDFSKTLEIWPSAPVGVYSDGLGRKDVWQNVIFGGVKSVVNALHLFAPFNLILIDEAHLVSNKEETEYRRVINHFKSLQNCPVVGLTATPYRLGSGLLTEPGGIFTDICLDLTTLEEFNRFFDEGWLCTLVPQPTETEYDISSVRLDSTGEFNQKQLQAAVDQDAKTRAAVAEMIRKGMDRKHWLIFAAGIKHARHVANILIENGIPTSYVHSNTKEFPFTDAMRTAAVEDFKSGRVRALVNNGVFTTGFDFPGIDLIGVLRWTTSPGLWVQILGRGIRPLFAPGFALETIEQRLEAIAMSQKPNCLVLDFARNSDRLGTINDPKRPKARGKKAPGEVPAKICPVCSTYNHCSARFCCHCKAEFPVQVRIEEASSNSELITKSRKEPTQIIEEWFKVENVAYSKATPWNSNKRREDGGIPSTLRVTYQCGLRSFTEHICLEHQGTAKGMAAKWWRESCKDAEKFPVPATVNEAITRVSELRQPSRIRVWVNRSNPQICFHEFPDA